MIENIMIRVKRSDLGSAEDLPRRVEESTGNKALRWFVAKTSRDDITVEATVYHPSRTWTTEKTERECYPGKSVALNLVPTGIGCSIGGYAGDASPTTNLLASAVDYLITNPNALNASNFIGLDRKNVLYTEGSCIDLFSKGQIDLHIPYSNRVGLIIEKTEDRHLDVVFNTVNAIRAIHGINIEECIVTDRRIGGRCVKNESGAFTGTVDNPEVIFEACEKLLKKGINAIALTSNVQDLPLDNYAMHFAGEYPNPVGGVEAVISHLVALKYQVPAAHAPMINVKHLDLSDNVVDARGAGEMTSESGLACVLIGLGRAPQIKRDANARVADVVNINNLLAVVAPATALGGIPSIYAQTYGVPVIAVEENQTILNVTDEHLGLRDVIKVRTYAEAAGLLLALKNGISLASITRPLKTLRK